MYGGILSGICIAIIPSFILNTSVNSSYNWSNNSSEHPEIHTLYAGLCIVAWIFCKYGRELLSGDSLIRQKVHIMGSIQEIPEASYNLIALSNSAREVKLTLIRYIPGVKPAISENGLSSLYPGKTVKFSFSHTLCPPLLMSSTDTISCL